MATHSSVLAWRVPATEEPGGLHRVGQSDLAAAATATVWNNTSLAAMENSMVTLQKIRHRITIWSNNSPCGCIPQIIENRDLEIFVYLYSQQHYYSSEKQPQYPSTDEWLNRVWYNELYYGIFFSLQKEGCYMDSWYSSLENMLSEISSVAEGQIVYDPTDVKYLIVRFIVTERILVARD